MPLTYVSSTTVAAPVSAIIGALLSGAITVTMMVVIPEVGASGVTWVLTE